MASRSTRRRTSTARRSSSLIAPPNPGPSGTTAHGSRFDGLRVIAPTVTEAAGQGPAGFEEWPLQVSEVIVLAVVMGDSMRQVLRAQLANVVKAAVHQGQHI